MLRVLLIEGRDLVGVASKQTNRLKLGHCQSGARARLLWSDADWISDCFVLYNILRLRTSFMILIHYCSIYYEVYFQSYLVHLHICTSAHSRRAPRRWINTIAGHMASGGFGRWFWTTGHSKRCKQPGFGMVFGFILLERLRHFFKVKSPSFRWTEGFKGGLFTVLRYDLAPGEKRCCEFQDEGLRQRWGLDGPRLCHEYSQTFSDIFLSEDIWSCASFRSKVGPPNGIVCHWKRSRMMRHIGREEVVRIAVLSTTCSHIAEDIVRGDLAWIRPDVICYQLGFASKLLYEHVAHREGCAEEAFSRPGSRLPSGWPNKGYSDLWPGQSIRPSAALTMTCQRCDAQRSMFFSSLGRRGSSEKDRATQCLAVAMPCCSGWTLIPLSHQRLRHEKRWQRQTVTAAVWCRDPNALKQPGLEGRCFSWSSRSHLWSWNTIGPFG